MISDRPRHVLLIESNTSGTGADFVARSRALGLSPILITSDPSKYSALGFPNIRTLTVETTAPEVILDSLTSHGIAPATVAGVTSSSDAGISSAAALAQKMGLPGPDPIAVETARDKYAARKALAATTLNPWFADAGEVDWTESLRCYPDGLVAKPRCGTGSMDVSMIRVEEDLPAFQPRPGEVLLEERLTGVEYSVEFLGTACLGVCLKRTNGLGLELGHQFPGTEDLDLHNRLTRAARRAMTALGLDSCAAHVELIWDVRTDRIKVVEINPRLAGGRIPDLLRLATNRDPVIEAIKLATEPGYVPANTRPVRGAAIEFMLRQAKGTPEPRGLERAWNSVGTVDLEVYPHRLHQLAAPANGDFRDRVGHVICVSTTAELASRYANEAIDRVTWARSEALTDDEVGGTAATVNWARDYDRCSVGLVRGTEPSHRFLSHRLQATGDLVEEVIDRHEISGQPRTAKAVRNRIAQTYHTLRRALMGASTLRRREFSGYSQLSPPDNQRALANMTIAPEDALPSKTRMDYIVFKGCGLVPKRLLDLARAPVLNLHGGWLPNYRGNHCYFYAFYNEVTTSDSELIVGSTLHEVTPKIDDGTILDHSRIQAVTARNVEHAYCLGELISFERFIRSLRFPSSDRFRRNALTPDHVQKHQPQAPSKLYFTRNRTPMEEAKLAVRKVRRALKVGNTRSRKQYE